eukprot:6203083-Pleurochrysis_carterae.AAC.1
MPRYSDDQRRAKHILQTAQNDTMTCKYHQASLLTAAKLKLGGRCRGGFCIVVGFKMSTAHSTIFDMIGDQQR